jgi:hypothetical protein
MKKMRSSGTPKPFEIVEKIQLLKRLPVVHRGISETTQYFGDTAQNERYDRFSALRSLPSINV